jgi:hypothetical protein
MGDKRLKITCTLRILLIVLGLNIVLGQSAAAQTPLGLLVTQEELTIWKQRAISGPYKSAGDVSTNSPGDWDRIVSNANALATGPGGNDYWPGNTCSGGWSCPAVAGNPIPNRALFERTRDAAFSWLVSGNTSHRDKAKTQLLALLAEPGLDFANTSRWNPNNTVASDPFTTVSLILIRLFVGYTYVRNQFTTAQQTSLDAWFLKMAVHFESSVQAVYTRGGFLATPRTDLTNFTLGSGFIAAASQPNGQTMYCGYPNNNWVDEMWANRVGAQMMLAAGVGIYFHGFAPTATTALLVQKSKRWVMEWLLYMVYPNLTQGEYRRSYENGTLGMLGWRYSQSAAIQVVFIADLLARAGDTELYEMVTTSTGISTRVGSTGTTNTWTWSVGKTLKAVVQENLKYVDQTLKRASLHCSAPVFSIDYQGPWAAPGYDQGSVADTQMALGNLYWQDTCSAPAGCIQTRYMRTSTNAMPYPAVPGSGGYCAWCGGNGALPGGLFLHGQMEGKVWPYPGQGGPQELPAPTDLKIVSPAE